MFVRRTTKPTLQTNCDFFNNLLDVNESNGTGIRTLGDFDHVVLLQGWWWADGEATRLWQSADPLKRSAFIIEQDADWPPRRLAEVTKEPAIRQFRSTLKSFKVFRDPSTLPELVGEVVSAELVSQTSSGALTAGLHQWERNYLAFRIPAWTSGRTAGRPHILEPENATELYRPDLYIPLNGNSARWAWRVSKTQTKLLNLERTRKSTLSNYDLRNNAALARWISQPELKRIALVGAPGGGKTVFLTRVAACFAHSCLGRPTRLEPSLSLEGLRSQSGTIPIPIVVEATRLSKHISLGRSALNAALAQELAQAGPPPDEAVLEAGLADGRYIIFIDAIDEIADAEIRTKVVDVLKGISGEDTYPNLRLVVTTRSARYTGTLAFGPELEVIDVIPFDESQVLAFCTHWTKVRKRDAIYHADLVSAVTGLAEQIEKEGGDESLTANPLMLTAICMVFERYQALPDDRARLCGLLVDDLCRSRLSEDQEHDWRLSDANKRDLLERIALRMQQEGAQSWPTSRAVEIAMRGVPSSESLRHKRATTHLHWAAEHTGLLRFHQPEEGEEEIRFWHRLFREFLAASRLSQEDITVVDLVNNLWENEFLQNPFWEDAIRLLPRTLGTLEKAKALREQLWTLGVANTNARGRLFGLAAAGIVESRDLFPDVDARAMSTLMAEEFQAHGQNWAWRDRLLFLDALGALNPAAGDPRLNNEKWIRVPEQQISLSSRGRRRRQEQTIPSFLIAWGPVTVQEFKMFVDSEVQGETNLWPRTLALDEFKSRVGWRKQLRYLNRPVTDVSYEEAMAYCRWRTGLRKDGSTVRLPTAGEAACIAKTLSVDTLNIELVVGNVPRTGINRCTPVGAFGECSLGAVDVVGNVLEWCSLGRSVNSKDLATVTLWQGCYQRVYDASYASMLGGYPEISFDHRYPIVGFRCVLDPFGHR